MIAYQYFFVYKSCVLLFTFQVSFNSKMIGVIVALLVAYAGKLPFSIVMVKRR